MTTRALPRFVALGLFLWGCGSNPVARNETDRATVLEACEAVFGAPVDPINGFFEVDRYFVLEAKFDDSGHLLQLGVFPKHYFGDAHPEWDETEDVGELTETQYEDLLVRLDRILPRGPLVKREQPVVHGMTLRRRDVYRSAVVVTGDVVDDTRPDDAPRAIKYFIVYPGV